MTWHYLDYVAGNGRIPIQEWLENQDPEVVAALNTVLYERKEMSDWLNPSTDHAAKQFKPLEKKHFGLSELRFSTTDLWTNEKRTFRVAGWYRPKESQFVLFTGCEKVKKSRAEVPPDAFDKALEYKADLANDESEKLIDHKR